MSASEDGTAKVWDADSGRELLKLSAGTAWVNDARFSRDGKRILTGHGDSEARLWDGETGELIRGFSGHGSEVSAARFMPGEEAIMTASHDGQARLFETSTGRLIRSFAGQKGGLSDIAITGDGTRLLTAASEDQAKVWDIQTGRELISLSSVQTANLRGFALSPSEDRLLPQGYRAQIEIREIMLWSELSRIGGATASLDQRIWEWQRRNHEFLQKIGKMKRD